MKNLFSRFRGLLLLIAIIVCLAVIIGYWLYPVSFIRNSGVSMIPTIDANSAVAVDRRVGEIMREDIVIFRFPKDVSQSFIKRVIGLPGDEVKIDKGRVFVNGVLLEEPYVEPKNRNEDDLLPVKVTENSYFVLGDNRRNSSDSRDWGAVSRQFIWGKALLH